MIGIDAEVDAAVRAAHAERMRGVWATNVAAGLCGCGRVRLPKRQTCGTCLERHAAYDASVRGAWAWFESLFAAVGTLPETDLDALELELALLAEAVKDARACRVVVERRAA